MGYDISERTYRLIDKRAAEGRLCSLDRPHIARAIWRVKTVSWMYREDRLAGVVAGRESESVFCDRCFKRFIKPWVGNTHSAMLGNVVYLSAVNF